VWKGQKWHLNIIANGAKEEHQKIVKGGAQRGASKNYKRQLAN